MIELMVVVAILGLLTAILFPSLKAARAKSHMVSCTSNLRQVGVAIASWTGDHNGNFVGIGGYMNGSKDCGGRLHWFCNLGRENYLGAQVNFSKRSLVDPGPMTVQYRWPVLKCPAEQLWNQVYSSVAASYSGEPYNNYLSEFVCSSYDLNVQVIDITHCRCDRSGSKGWCSGGVGCDQPTSCCAMGFTRPTWEGYYAYPLLPATTPGNALIVMDGWLHDQLWGDQYPSFDINTLGTDSSGNPISISSPPSYPWGHNRLHAYRHPNLNANGLFLDGHVAPFRPAEFTSLEERPHYRIWRADIGINSEH